MPGLILVLGGCIWALAGAGCSGRPNQLGDPRWTVYMDLANPTQSQASPILATRCGGCHTGAAAQAGYQVDTYLGAVGRRDDGTPRATAGDPNSMLLDAAQGKLARHPPVPSITADEIAVLTDWVVRSRLASKQYTVHDKGWMDPGNSAEFHGRVWRSTAYRPDQCTGCHGADYRGGISGVDCYSCHPSGISACNTCHGDATSPAPPRDLNGIRATSSVGVGAHRAHVLATALHTAYGCEKCHFNPVHPEDEGHYQLSGQLLSPPVRVMMLSGGTGQAAWNHDVASCTNSYCHAPYADARASHQVPIWNRVGAEEAACGTCHGIPPPTPSHADNRCQTCHRPAFAFGVLRPDMHANGTLDLAAAPGQCVGCHGSGTNPAPPIDVLGRSDEILQTVGAHRAHLEARRGISAPVACTECHRVPTSLNSPGHIDHLPPAEVFPAAAGRLARVGGANPAYNSTTASCGSVYCHGGGPFFADETAPGRITTPVWNAGSSQSFCGSCHGIPPQTPTHPPALITQCVNCHGLSIDGNGLIRVSVDPTTGQLTSTHIDGEVTGNGP